MPTTSPPSRTYRYLLQEVLLVFMISYLLLFASTHNGIVDGTILAVTGGVFTVFSLAWLAARPYPATRVEYAVVFFLGLILVTVFTSIDPRRSWVEFWLLGLAFFLCLGAAELVRRGWPAELMVKCLLIAGAIVMLFAWVEVVNWYAQWLAASGSLIPSISFRLSIPNFFGVVLNVLLMMAAGRGWATKAGFSRLLLALYALSALLLQYLTSSRGGWLGTAAGLGVLCLLWLWPERGRLAGVWRGLRRRPVVLAGGLLAGFAVLAGMAWLLYLQGLQPSHADSIFGARSVFWIPAWQAFTQSPLVGKGPYTFISLFLQHNSVPPWSLFVYAHNIYLDLLSGSGLLGLAGFLVLVGVVLQTLAGRLRQAGGEERGVIIGALAALAAFGVHGLVDSVHHTIPTSAWVLALAVGPALGAPAGPGKGTRLRAGAFLGLLVAGLTWANLWMLAPYAQGVAAANGGDWQSARSLLAIAAQRDPHNSAVFAQLGLAESELAGHGQADALPAAIDHFERAAALDPYWALNHANLGALYMAVGETDRAVEAFQSASDLAPGSATYALNLGAALEQAGRPDDSRAAYQRALQRQPGWVDSSFWQASDFRRQLQAGWRADHPIETPDLATLAAQAAQSQGYAAAYLDLGEAYLAAGQPEPAAEAVQLAGLAYFQSDEEHLRQDWLRAGLAAQAQDAATVDRLGAAVLQGLAEPGVYGPGAQGKLLYYQLMFRRPAMAVEMVPQMQLIRVGGDWAARLSDLLAWYTHNGDTGAAEQVRALLQSEGYDLPGGER
ncbi:MAG: tetratricopeptide repeat protein [Chloroflexi bacterium]|nr:tetratricopeptide repeat protein [Chloroflexota bacterium]